MKSTAPYLVAFMVLILAAIALGNVDPITPAVVKARAESGVGPVYMSLINQGTGLAFKLLAGSTVAAIVGVVWVETRKRLDRYWREETTRRWRRSGSPPVQRSLPAPRMSREELLMLLLREQVKGSGRLSAGDLRSKSRRDQGDGDDLSIEF